METSYAPIQARLMRAGTIVRQPLIEAAARVQPGDAATAVMTDLRQVPAVLTDPDVDIEAATRVMIRRNVRSLFVVDVDNAILGLITATDLLGEKPMQHLARYGGRRADIRVRDLMTPRARLEVLPMAEVAHARVGHILATLKLAGRQHAMVVEEDGQGHDAVRGVFSASQLEKQLGTPVSTGAPARTFAEIEAELSHSTAQ
ncbi:MAG: CBS domain-containing protein [Betaproteobacteria bacterium]|nr:MAG: CBS domain-containing protein [Betaproteobacteria bacterium]